MTLALKLSKYTSQSFWLILEKIFRLGLSLIGNSIVIRYLGAKDFGILSYSTSIVFLFSAFSNLGLELVVIRRIVENESSTPLIIGVSIILKLIASCICVLLVIILSGFNLFGEVNSTIVILVSLFLIFQSFNAVEYKYQATLKSRMISVSKTISFTFFTILRLLFVYLKLDLIWFGVLISVEYFLYIISYHYVNKVNAFKPEYKIDLALTKSMLQESWPLIFSGVVSFLYIRVDQLMITNLLGAEENGIYSAAARLSEAWYIIPNMIIAAVYPAIVKLKSSRSNQSLIDSFQALYSFFALLSVFASVVVLFLSDHIITVLYGKEFMESSLVLSIQIWSGIFIFFRVLSGKWLVSEGYQKKSLERSIVGLVVNVILNLFLIKKYGIIGAAVASLISFAVVGLVYDLINKVTRVHFVLKIKSIIYMFRIKRILKILKKLS